MDTPTKERAEEVQLTVRMPVAMRERLEALAEASDRSLNKEVLHLLRVAMNHDR
jgi:predicted HicB family RNase H-like nuclease